MALYHCDCPQMRADYYCEEHNPLGGDYSQARAELAAEQAAHPYRGRLNTRREVRWGYRRGSAGWGKRRRG